MHDSRGNRKTLSAQTRGALPMLAMLGGNLALAFGPWFVRAADVGPIAAGFWRMTLAAPMLIALAFATRSQPFAGARRHVPVLILGGVAFAGDLASWHLGLMRTTLANSTLFGNSATLIFPVYGFIVARALPTRTQGLAFALALIGAGLLLGRSYELSPKNLAGDLLSMLAGVIYTVYLVVMSRVRTELAPLPALALSTCATTLPMLLVAWGAGETIWPHAWGVLIGLALASQIVGQGLTIYAIGHLPPLVMGIGLLTQPIVAGTIGWIVYGERLGLPDFIGAALVAAALVLVRARRTPALAPGGETPTPG